MASREIQNAYVSWRMRRCEVVCDKFRKFALQRFPYNIAVDHSQIDKDACQYGGN